MLKILILNHKKFKMIKQKGSFSFDVPLELNEKWMMGVTSLEVYNAVYIIPSTNNKLEIRLTEQQPKELGIDTELVPNVANLYKTSEDKFVEKIYTFNNSYSTNSKLTGKDFNDSKEIIEVLLS